MNSQELLRVTSRSFYLTLRALPGTVRPQTSLDVKHAMTKGNLAGAPGTKEVAKQLARWREQLS
jgi:hypothetical protein